MTYYISKIINGDMHRLHNSIPNFETAHDMLVCMGAAEKRNKNKVKLNKWSLVINDNEIVYQIVMGE